MAPRHWVPSILETVPGKPPAGHVTLRRKLRPAVMTHDDVLPVFAAEVGAVFVAWAVDFGSFGFERGRRVGEEDGRQMD